MESFYLIPSGSKKEIKNRIHSTAIKKAEPLPALPLKTKGRKRKLFFALLFEVKHDIFKDDGDADDSLLGENRAKEGNR